MKLFRTGFFSILFMISIVFLAACSNNKVASTGTIENMQKVEMGTIVSIKTITLKPEDINSYGRVGVSVGSGRHSGIYGAVDLATLGKLYRNTTKPTTAQQLIITKANGETVAITQVASKEIFKVGDTVKLLLQDGKAKVVH